MILKLTHIVRTLDHVRSHFDERVRVTRVIAEYKGEDALVYRKSFEAKGEPEVPAEGTHEQLNGKGKQW